MAAEAQAPAPEAPAAATTEVVVAAVPEAKKKPAAKESPLLAPESPDEDVEAPHQLASFKEESNVVADLVDPQRKALDELRDLVRAAIANNEFRKAPPPKEGNKVAEKPTKEEEAEAEKAAEADEPTAEAEEPTAEPEEVLVAGAEEQKQPPVAAAVEVLDEDGAKTVEAIEETVVPVSASSPPPPPKEEEEAEGAASDAKQDAPGEEVSIWGVSLLGSEGGDTVLLKFLRARDFKPRDALAMMKATVLWRHEFGIDRLLRDEDLGMPTELDRVVFMRGQDREGHPVCYNVYGEFQDRELYQKALGDEGKRGRFLRWRVRVLEKGIRDLLDFGPQGICTMVQVIDLKNSPGPWRKELKQATDQALALLQDNYPEFVAKQVFINVPWWYMAFNKMISPFLTQRTKSKFVFASPAKSSETLFKYIAPEQVPVQFGGLSVEDDSDFTTSDAVQEVTIKPSSKQTIEIPVSETCLLVWELRVVGGDVRYGAEFVPNAEGGYAVIVQKLKKLDASNEPVVKNSFKISEPGKVVLTIENPSSKKKKLLYRAKTKKSTAPM